MPNADVHSKLRLGQRADVRPRSAVAPRWYWPGVVVALLLCAVLRFVRLGDQNYWLDELHSLANSAGNRAEFESVPRDQIIPAHIPPSTQLDQRSSLVRTWRNMRNDTHPPVYFTILYAWRRLVGDGEFAVRSLSALFSALTILPLAWIFLLVKKPRAGLIACVLFAVSAIGMRTGQDARPYALAVFLVTTSHGFFLRYMRNSGSLRSVILWATVCCVAILTHYFTALAFAGQFAWGLISLGWRKLAVLSLSAVAAGGLAAFIWGPPLTHQLPVIRAQHWLDESGPEHLPRTMLRFMDLPARQIIPLPDYEHDQYLSALGMALFAGCLIVALVRRQRSAGGFAVMFAVPALALLALDLATDKQLLSHPRYSAVAAPALICLVAVAIEAMSSWLRWVLVAALLGIIGSQTRLPSIRNAHSELAGAELRQRIAPGDLLLFDTSFWPVHWMDHLFAPVHYYYPDCPAATLLMTGPPKPELLAQIQRFDRVFVVSPRIDDLPNPSPTTHEKFAQSDNVWHVGWIYIFRRIGS